MLWNTEKLGNGACFIGARAHGGSFEMMVRALSNVGLGRWKNRGSWR